MFRKSSWNGLSPNGPPIHFRLKCEQDTQSCVNRIEFQSSKSCPGNIYLKLQNTWNFFTATPSEFVEKIVLPNWKTLRSVCVSSLRQQCFWAVSKANTKVETCLISGSQNWFWLNDFTGCNLFSWKRLSNSNIQTTRTKFGCGCP